MIIRIHNTDGSTKGSGLPIYSSVSEYRAWELARSGQLRLLRIYEIKKVRFKKLSEWLYLDGKVYLRRARRTDHQGSRTICLLMRIALTTSSATKSGLRRGMIWKGDQVKWYLLGSAKCHGIPKILYDFRSTDASASSGRTGYLWLPWVPSPSCAASTPPSRSCPTAASQTQGWIFITQPLTHLYDPFCTVPIK